MATDAFTSNLIFLVTVIWRLGEAQNICQKTQPECLRLDLQEAVKHASEIYASAGEKKFTYFASSTPFTETGVSFRNQKRVKNSSVEQALINHNKHLSANG